MSFYNYVTNDPGIRVACFGYGFWVRLMMSRTLQRVLANLLIAWEADGRSWLRLGQSGDQNNLANTKLSGIKSMKQI